MFADRYHPYRSSSHTCDQSKRNLSIGAVYQLRFRKARDIEVHVETTTLSVHVNPYFLRLVFDAPIVEDDASTARYDPSSGDLTVTVSKQVPGQHFNDLDLLPKLLAPEGSSIPQQPLIEVLDEDDAILQGTSRALLPRACLFESRHLCLG